MGLIAAAGVLLAWATTPLIWPPGDDIPRYVVLFGLAWLAWLLGVRLTLALPADHFRRDQILILLVGILIRLPMVLSSPSLSDDVFRTVWDARLIEAGINPYLQPPGDRSLEHLRDDEIWARVNAKEQRTPYPPAAEVLGLLGYRLAPESPRPFQVIFAGFDLATGFLLALLLGRLGLDPRRSIVVLWSPLGALHFGHSAHNDSAMLAALVGAAFLLARPREPAEQPPGRERAAAGFALAVAVLVKVVPLLAVPVFLRHGRLALGAGASLAVVALGAPFAGAGLTAVTGLLEEGSEARFNDSLFWVLEAGLDILGVDAALERIVAALAVGASALWLAWRSSSAMSILPSASWALGTYLMLSAVVQPWYVTWLAPLIALAIRPGPGVLFGRSGALPWLWLSGAVTLSELWYAPGYAAVWPIIRAVEYGPFYALLLWSLRRKR